MRKDIKTSIPFKENTSYRNYHDYHMSNNKVYRGRKIKTFKGLKCLRWYKTKDLPYLAMIGLVKLGKDIKIAPSVRFGIETASVCKPQIEIEDKTIIESDVVLYPHVVIGRKNVLKFGTIVEATLTTIDNFKSDEFQVVLEDTKEKKNVT